MVLGVGTAPFFSMCIKMYRIPTFSTPSFVKGGTHLELSLQKTKDFVFELFGTRSFRKKTFQNFLRTESFSFLQIKMVVELKNGPS